MSSTIYNHRTLQPTAPPAPVPVTVPVSISATGPPVNHAPPHHRLDEVLEGVRREFDLVTQDINALRGQRDEYDGKISGQVNELNAIRNAVYELEARHSKIKQSYEEELARLRTELNATRQGMGIPQTSDPSVRQQPISVTDALRQAPGLTANDVRSANPPPGYAYPDYGREREREMREREREREREMQIRDQRAGGPVGPIMPGDREREREMRDRDRERDRDRIERERMMDRERERDRMDREREREGPSSVGREGKRKDRDRTKAEYYPGPGGSKHAVPGSPHPQHGFHGLGPGQSLPSPSAQLGPAPPLPPLQQQQGPGQQGIVAAQPYAAVTVPGSYPDDFDPALAPPDLKKEGSDWFAVFSKQVPQRRLDVNLVHTLEHESVVCCVRFSADGKYLATGCNRTAQIYDTKTGAKTCVLIDEGAAKAGDLYIRSLCFSPDGKYLATGAEDKQIRIWDIAKRRIRTVFEGHQQEIYSLDFSRDGRLIVSGSGDKTARIWDMETGAHKALLITEPADVDAGVTSVAISPDGRLVAAGSLDTIVRLWDVQSGALIERLMGHSDSVYSVAFTPDGKGLVSGSLDQTLKHWDLGPLLRHPGRATPLRQPSEGAGVKKEQGQSEKGCACTVNFTGHKDYVLSVAVSHDSQWVVSGSKDRCVQFWDLRTAQAQLMLQGHKNSVISIDLSPTGGMLATGSGDWAARLWSYTTPQ